MNGTLYYEIQINKLIQILKSKRLTRILLQLLKYIQFTNDKIIIIDSYSRLAKLLGYETKSGLWKALKQLEKTDVITIYDNVIYFNTLTERY